jgi:hypothetical protein
MRRTLTVILASDVAGYSRLVADHEEDTIARFRHAATVFAALVKKHEGSIFNTAGDAILAKFDSAVDAVRCAIDIQDANNGENASIAERDKLLFRMGIAIGDVVVSENGDLLGDAVNIAEEVRAHVLNKISLNVVDLGNRSLRNIPRAIRVFKIISQFVAVPQQSLMKQPAARKLMASLATAAFVLAVGSSVLSWQFNTSSHGLAVGTIEEPFDSSKVPLVTDRVQNTLAKYGQEPYFKAIAISREGWGVSIGAADVESAKREALDRCNHRSTVGYCSLYAVGNKVVWSKTWSPLAVDIRDKPLDDLLTADDVDLVGWRTRPSQQFQAYLNLKGHRALAVSQESSWSTSNRSSPAEAARIAVERCSDLAQTPCLLISVDGYPTQRLPRNYQVTGPFAIAGEREMTDADKQRIAQIYVGDDWRALAKGSSAQWYAVSGAESEAAAVSQVLKACRARESGCTLHAIGNFRVGNSIESPKLAEMSEAPLQRTSQAQ